jgi:ketosteroid isomerase-like protein
VTPPDLANEQLLRQQSRPHRWRYELKGKNVSATKYAAYAGAEPYFTLVRQALGDLVDGKHFFDVVADNIAYEVLYELGWPRLIRGRANLMAAFGGYVESVRIQSADTLVVHKADDARVVIVEYEVHGTIIATGARYDNRFCSIITLEDRKIAQWRDYMDSHAAWKAMTAAA